jgi:outer membrane protein assembly factor BamE
MHKLLIHIALTASLLLTGCASTSDWSLGTNIARGLDGLPFVYKPTIQQGNIVSQEDIDRLQPGMTKRQVRFALGTPMLVDVFHQDRWDYVFTEGVGSEPDARQGVHLFFENDQLVRIEGDMRPGAAVDQDERRGELVVDVPDWDGERNTLWDRTMRAVGVKD